MATLTTTIAPAPVVLPNGAVLHRLTVADYHRMIDVGVLNHGDKIELLDGLLVEQPLTRKPPHDNVLTRLNLALIAALGDRALLVRNQAAITLEDSEPEPDFAIARGLVDDFEDRHPRAADVALVIEVADATLRQDRGVKATVYARARLPIYWIVNLPDDVIEVYTEPTGDGDEARYTRREVRTRDDELVIVIDDDVVATLKVDKLLPSTPR